MHADPSPSARRTRRTELAGNFCCRARPEAFASAAGLCPMSATAHLDMNQVDTLTISQPQSRKKRDRRWHIHTRHSSTRWHEKPESAALANLWATRRHCPNSLSCYCNLKVCLACLDGLVLHHVKGLHYRTYRLPLRQLVQQSQSVLSSLTVPVPDSTTCAFLPGAVETCKKRTCSRFPIRLQPLTGRTALPPSEQTNILAFNTGAPTSYPHI